VSSRRSVSSKERKYLDELVRGVYAKNDLEKGTAISQDDIFLAIPLQDGQLSCREIQ